MSAWSFPKKGDAVESVARPLSVESLDGQRVRGRLTVRFDRALAMDVADRLVMELASTVAAIMGEQICEGRVPFSGEELVARVTSRSRLNARVSSFGFSALEVADVVAAHQSSRPVTSPARSGVPPARSAAPPARSVTPAARSAAPPSGAPERTGPSSGASGVMPAVSASVRAPGEPSPGAIRTLWPRALGASQAGVPLERVGQLFAPALRDSTAAAVFAMLGAVDPAALDRLELIEGNQKRKVLPLLRREAGACIAAAFYRVLIGALLEQPAAHQVAETACGEALAPDALPTAEIQRYVASAAPLRDLANVAAAALGAPDDSARLFAVLSSYGTALRGDLMTAASNVKRMQGPSPSASNSPGRREP